MTRVRAPGSAPQWLGILAPWHRLFSPAARGASSRIASTTVAAPEADRGALTVAVRHEVDDDEVMEPLAEPRGLRRDLRLAVRDRVARRDLVLG